LLESTSRNTTHPPRSPSPFAAVTPLSLAYILSTKKRITARLYPPYLCIYRLLYTLLLSGQCGAVIFQRLLQQSRRYDTTERSPWKAPMAERNELGAHPDGVNPLRQIKNFTVKKREGLKKPFSRRGELQTPSIRGGEVMTITVGCDCGWNPCDYLRTR
jgi:hypothetical protein